jgi:hypothetical protein
MSNVDAALQEQALGMANPAKRASKCRLVTMTDENGGEHQVLANNMYNLQEGEPSVFDGGKTDGSNEVSDLRRNGYCAIQTLMRERPP